MVALNLVFHFHSPWKPVDFRARHVGGARRDYTNQSEMLGEFGDRGTRLFHPLLNRLLGMSRSNKLLRVSFSASRDFLELGATYDPSVVEKLQTLVSRKCADVVATPAIGGLSGLVCPDDFVMQIKEQRRLLVETFSCQPRAFHNTELIYCDYLGRLMADLGFSACMFEGVESLLPPNCSPTTSFHHIDEWGLRLIPHSRFLAEDLYRRFGAGGVANARLNPSHFVGVLEGLADNTPDYLTVFLNLNRVVGGQGSLEELVNFLADFVELCDRSEHIDLLGINDIIDRVPSRGGVSVPSPTSQRGVATDLSFWLGNTLQTDLLGRLAEMALPARTSGDPDLLRTWRQLCSCDVFEALRIHHFDGRPALEFAGNPYEMFIRVANIAADLKERFSAGTEFRSIVEPMPVPMWEGEPVCRLTRSEPILDSKDEIPC